MASQNLSNSGLTKAYAVLMFNAMTLYDLFSTLNMSMYKDQEMYKDPVDCLPAPLTMTLSSWQEQNPRHREELGSVTVRSMNVAMQGCLFLSWFLALN